LVFLNSKDLTHRHHYFNSTLHSQQALPRRNPPIPQQNHQQRM
jgi:hypothetical protein